jgi:hypothetical protein
MLLNVIFSRLLCIGLVYLKCSGAVSFQDRLFAAAQDDTVFRWSRPLHMTK